jgi:Fe-S cluster assembly iron-binding protein IscA
MASLREDGGDEEKSEMISVTSPAAAELQALLKHSRAQPGQGVKLAPNGKGGLSMTIGAPCAGDTVIHRDDIPLLIVDGSIAGRLDGLVFDYLMTEVDGRPNNGFTFRRPGADESPAPSGLDGVGD